MRIEEKQTVGFQDCLVSFDGTRLTAQNNAVCRTWELTPAGLVPRMLRDEKTGEVLSKGPAGTLSPETGDILESDDAKPPHVDVTLAPVETGGELPAARLTGEEDDDYGFAPVHLKAVLHMDYTVYSLRFVVELYPGMPFLRTRIFARGSTLSPLHPLVALDSLSLEEKHCEWNCISLNAITDFHNNLLFSQKGLFYRNETRTLCGNILCLRRTIQGDGVVLVKESGAGEEQVRYGGMDFLLSGASVSMVTSGYLPEDLQSGEYIPLYACAIGVYHGGEAEFSRWLFAYQEARHSFHPARDGRIVSNTWGDCSHGENIDEEFLEKDLSAAHEMGVEYYEIDAGWDSGAKEKGGRCLWEISSRLPYRFAKLKQKADSFGMELGVWFVPDTLGVGQYDRYQDDAKRLTDLYRQDGIKFFKLDGTKLLSYAVTWRLERMQQLVLKQTDNNVFFHMDITNWPRTGLLGGTQYSSLFWENRYSDRLSYYPHCTLRSLWQVSRYFPLYRIQSEYLNVERCDEVYQNEKKDDPLRPGAAGQLWSAAVTLFTSPLVWMEPCGLSKEKREQLSKLYEKLGKERMQILSSSIFPIGNVPDGVSVTGFQAVKDDKNGWLLLLSEAGVPAETFMALDGAKNWSSIQFACIASNCEKEPELSSVLGKHLLVRFEQPFSFAVYRYQMDY